MTPKLIGFEKYLSDYGPVVFDESCDEPIGWGFEVTDDMSEERFESLKRVYHVEYLPLRVIVLWLSHDEAVEKYGKKVGFIERGLRGGFKSITFGDTQFSHLMMSPDVQTKVDKMARKEQERRNG